MNTPEITKKPSTGQKTLFDKLWERHLVRAEEAGLPAALYVDLHLLHEVTSPQAFTELRERGLRLRRPDKTLATMDHSTPTRPGGLKLASQPAQAQLRQLVANCEEFGVAVHQLGDARHGIVHVIGPEQGRTRPGMTIVCGDSHTSTHGAFGTLAFGIGTSEVAHVLATQCLLQRKPKSMQVRFEGQAGPGVTAKDLVLAMIGELGTGGATGHVIEYAGPAIEALDMEGRMTVCNMSIEAGARAGMIAPDETTFAYLEGREHAPKGAAWQEAVDDWRSLRSDEGASYDRTLVIDASSLAPMLTWGTNPGQCVAVDRAIPSRGEDDARALDYMGLKAGHPLAGRPLQVVFVGSCTNSRLSDLRLAAEVMKQGKVSPGVRMLVVPGSMKVKREAEAEGLHQIFTDAGAEWREPGCSMCIAMNGDQLEPGQYAVSTSNRNFEGRQGPGGRTFLASPATAAASAIRGVVSDPRPFLAATAAL